MNIKHDKNKIVYEFTPVTYKDKQYTCTISEPNTRTLLGILIGLGTFACFVILMVMRFMEKNPDLIWEVVFIAFTVLILVFFLSCWSGSDIRSTNIFTYGSVEGNNPMTHLLCSLYSLDDNSKIYEKDVYMFSIEWADMREQYDYQELISYVFRDYERKQAKDNEIESKKNWNMVVETEQNQEEK